MADEARHLEVMLHRLAELGVDDAESEFEARANPSLLAFRKRLGDFVEAKDWEASLLAQNVILESMEFAAFHSHMQSADARTAEMLSGVLKDERRHMGFGENDLGRHLARCAPRANAPRAPDQAGARSARARHLRGEPASSSGFRRRIASGSWAALPRHRFARLGFDT